MSKFFTLYDRSLERINNRPYFRGTWEPLRMERNRLIPFQVRGSSVEIFQVVNGVENDISGRMNGLIDVHSDYLTYNGGIFSDYLTEGRCYFKINDKYSDDVDIIDLNIRPDYAINNNILTGWNNIDYTTFTHDANTITNAQNGDLNAGAQSNEFLLMRGNTIKVIIYIAKLTPSYVPTLYLESGSEIINIPIEMTLEQGELTYEATYIVSVTGYYRMKVESYEGDTAYFGLVGTVYNLSDIEIEDAVSADYLKIMVSSDVDFGGTYYKGGFTQVFWKQGTVERGQTADVEVIGDERNGVLVKEKITTSIKYNVKLKVTEPEYTAMVEALPGNWTITETNGKVYTCKNVEINTPEWYQGNGIMRLTFNDNITTFAYNNTDL